MKKLILFIFFIFCSNQLNSQGFDWQYSARLPVEYPNLFAGVNVNYALYSHQGDFGFLQFSDTCCNYSNGSGTFPFAGINLEYWIESGIALKASIDYKIFNSSFSNESTYPKRDRSTGEIYDWEQRFTSEVDLHYLFFNFGGKYRILSTHFSIGGHAGIGILTSNKSSNFKESLTPRFTYNNIPGNYKVELESTRIPDPNEVLIYPTVSFAYDLNLGRGLYASPNISVMIPWYNLINKSDGKWYPWSVSLGVSVLRGFRISGI